MYMKIVITESQYRKLINEEKTQIEYNSEFLDGVIVVVLFEDDPMYEKVKGFFEDYVLVLWYQVKI